MTNFPKQPITYSSFSGENYTAFFKLGVLTIRHANGDFYKGYPMSANEADAFFFNITAIAA